MPLTRYTTTAILLCIFSLLAINAAGQLTLPKIDKPKGYEERTLKSEDVSKKFTTMKRFWHNTGTHYNFYFNANNKLNEVIERAKLTFVDDYSLLLPFYNYSLDVTAADSIQLDSIIDKTQTGIALHDQRNDWIDNLYLLWGAGYYLRKDFDSAYLMFQFINYQFNQSQKEDYYKTIGSSRDGAVAYSIATKEKNSLPRRIFTEPPSRNDAFIWQIRNFLAQDLTPEAASLIVTLRNDPVFPKRLKNDLEEVQAYYFYKQGQWDSAASHLVNALDNAPNKRERARWEYLLAQLYELSGKYKESEKYFAKAINHTTDPILDIYARLYSIRVNKDGGENYIDKNIAELLKMARRTKYEDYRDIIYYMAAQMQLERNNIEGAMPLLLKSTQYASNSPTQRNRAFLQLAELSFNRKQYRNAYNFYDSLRMDDPALKEPEKITARKEMLGRIATNSEIIERQDSLQRIAAMPEEARKDFVKDLTKRLRKQQGLKAEDISSGNTNPVAGGTNTPPPLFNNTESKGDWYFYSNSSRTKGAADFKSRWGNRVNTDNWRRMAASAALQDKMRQAANSQIDPSKVVKGQGVVDGGEITFDGLYNKLPLTPEQLKASNDSIQQAMFKLGKAYIQEIEDCAAGTETMEGLRSRFPQFTPMDEVLFNLYYCYHKNGESGKAAAIKKLMSDQYGNSNFTTIVTTGKNPQSKTGNTEANKTYENIYDLFIEGKFDEAISQKKIADSVFGKHYWTPQLLYIESVYYIKQQQDSVAISKLNNIVSQFPNTPLATKATTMIDVLGRRKQIEEELRNLDITRPARDTTTRYRPVAGNPVTQPVRRDTTTIKPITQPTVNVPTRPKVDTTINKPVVLQPIAGSVYSHQPDAPHYVVLVLNKVDPVFCNEARNAFARYNRDTYYNKQFDVTLVEINPDNKVLLITPFKNAAEAVAYVDQARPLTATSIIPWLKGGKYTFSVISERNLILLKEKKVVEDYQLFINREIPNKF
jgi:tetratricopeptide (TPR) repeat protein